MEVDPFDSITSLVTRIALSLPTNTPRHYTFAFPQRTGDDLALYVLLLL